MEPKDFTIAELRKEYPELDEYLSVEHNKNIEIKKLKEALSYAESTIISLEEENDTLKVERRLSNEDVINMVESILNIKNNQDKEKDNG